MSIILIRTALNKYAAQNPLQKWMPAGGIKRCQCYFAVLLFCLYKVWLLDWEYKKNE